MPAKTYTLGKSKSRGVDLTVPSGATCKVKFPSPQALIGAGVLDSLDSLTALVGAKLNEIDGKAQAEVVAKMAENKANIDKALSLVDRVVEFMLLEPSVIRPVLRDQTPLGRGKPVLDGEGNEVPLPDEDRVESQIYTDDIDLEDRMFILQFAVGGSKDLDSFRSQTAGLMGGVAAGSAVSLPAK
jgi:hypothetical protein